MSTPITAGGTYSITGDCHLANDINVAGGTALTFTKPGVRLNMNGHTIRNTAPSPTVHSTGIHGRGSQNLVVEGGSITGFRFGINSTTPWTRLEHIDFSGCLYIGANLTGHTSRVLSCTADGIGGVSDAAYAIAINIGAGGCRIEENIFRNIYRQSAAPANTTGEGCPILINSSAGSCTIARNFIENDTLARSTIGVFVGFGAAHKLDRNVIRGMERAIVGATENAPMTATRNVLWMPLPKIDSKGIDSNHGTATDNLIVGYDTPVHGNITQQNNTIC